MINWNSVMLLWDKYTKEREVMKDIMIIVNPSSGRKKSRILCREDEENISKAQPQCSDKTD